MDLPPRRSFPGVGCIKKCLWIIDVLLADQSTTLLSTADIKQDGRMKLNHMPSRMASLDAKKNVPALCRLYRREIWREFVQSHLPFFLVCRKMR